METAAAALGIIGALACLLIRKHSPELALTLALLCAVGILLRMNAFLGPIIAFAGNLQALTGLPEAVFTPVKKAVALSILTGLASCFCQDAGEKGLSRSVELAGAIGCIYVSLPLLTMLLELLQRLLSA